MTASIYESEPATYSGAVNYFAQPAGAWQVTVWVTDVLIAGPVTTTVENGVARFTVQVPEDDPATPQRDGARSGDTLTFKVNGMAANETRGWTAGGLFQANLTVTHMDVCAFALFDANRNTVHDPDEGAAAGGQFNLYTTFDDQLVASYLIPANSPPHCFSGLNPTGYRLVFTPPPGQVLASAGVVTFQPAPPQAFQPPVAPQFTFRSVAPLDMPTTTATPSPPGMPTVTVTLTPSPTSTSTPTPITNVHLDKPVYATYADRLLVTVFDLARYTSGSSTSFSSPIAIYSDASATRIRLNLYRNDTVPGQYSPDINSVIGFCEACGETDVVNLQLKVRPGSIIKAEYRSLDGTLYTVTSLWQFNPIVTITPTPIGLTLATSTATATAIMTMTITPTPTTQATALSKPAVYREGGAWYLRNTLTSGVADIMFIYGGQIGEIPLMCDWDGDGTKTPGVVRGNVWFIRNSNSAGPVDAIYIYGQPGDIPLCGDWGGHDMETLGVFRNGAWFLKNTNSGGVSDISFSYGLSSDIPLVGDWDGNGTDTSGIRRGNAWYMRSSNSSGVADTIYVFGAPDDIPIAGNWSRFLGDTAAVVRPMNNVLVWFLRFVHVTGPADYQFLYGLPGDIPLMWK